MAFDNRDTHNRSNLELVEDHPLYAKAEAAGEAWAAQFTLAEGALDVPKLRGVLASAYAAGWGEGWTVALREAKAVLEGVRT